MTIFFGNYFVTKHHKKYSIYLLNYFSFRLQNEYHGDHGQFFGIPYEEKNNSY